MSGVFKTSAGLVALFVLGALAVVLFGATGGISRYLYILVDLPGLVLCGLIVVLAGLAALAIAPRHLSFLFRLRAPKNGHWMLAGIMLAVTMVATHLVYQGFAFSMDEWMTRLQADIFRSGHFSAVVPEAWRDYGRAMYHFFAAYDPDSGRLASDYRPGMAGFFAGFDLLGLGLYSAAFFNAGSVALVALVARRLWPDRPDIAMVSALLLAVSQQALAAAMTSYAMSAHLFFNLLWIWFFARGRWYDHLNAALVGVVTASLHQIHVHAFFALPFLLTLLRPFRLGPILVYGGVYLAGHGLIYSWDWWSINQYVTPSGGAGRSLSARALRLLQLPSVNDLNTVFANLVRLVAWQNLALMPLVAAALTHWRTDRWVFLLTASLVFSLLPYVFLMPDQGHGWGYRYLHGLLGPLALLAGFGWSVLKPVGAARYLNFVLLLGALSALMMLPFRAGQIRAVVTPYAQAVALVNAVDADVVIVDDERIFLGQDLVRNSAVDLRAPVKMMLASLNLAQIAALCADYKVAYFGADALGELRENFLIVSDEDLRDPEFYARKIDALAAPECNEAGG